jgi:hypothetical protein
MSVTVYGSESSQKIIPALFLPRSSERGTPARTAMCAAMKSFQFVFWLRLCAGGMPWRRRMLPTVCSETT